MTHLNLLYYKCSLLYTGVPDLHDLGRNSFGNITSRWLIWTFYTIATFFVPDLPNLGRNSFQNITSSWLICTSYTIVTVFVPDLHNLGRNSFQNITSRWLIWAYYTIGTVYYLQTSLVWLIYGETHLIIFQVDDLFEPITL